ncbi:MAG: hypothetical protein Alpg2KO_12810 [Alphaproteobacteria bacterium]
MTDTPSDLLDQATIDQLVDVVGQARMLPILTDWAADLQRNLDTLETALATADQQQLADLAHPFASSSLQLGAAKLGNSVRELEFMALEIEGRHWDADKAATLFDECRKIAPASSAALIAAFNSP